MGLITAFTGALGGTFADQWKDIITAGYFDEHTAVTPGIFQQINNGRGSNYKGSDGIISNGSKIYIPENTAAFIFDQSGIETVISTPGGYVYQNGQDSIFNGNGISKSILGEVKNRFAFGGQPGEQKRIAFINLREIRGLKFGTPGPLVYNDLFYGTDLEILARGTLSLHIVDPVTFVRNFVPANVMSYSFDDPNAKQQILSEYMQSFTVALNSLSGTYRISQLPSQATEITKSVTNDQDNAGTWRERFGFEISKIGIESIEFSPDSKELVKQFSSNKMSVKAYEDVSQNASNIAAQQKIAQGIESHGLGDGGGMIFGMNLAQSLNSRGAQQSSAESAQATNSDSSSEISRPEEQKAPAMSWEERVNMVKKLKDLLDADILTQDEFDQKKKEILGL